MKKLAVLILVISGLFLGAVQSSQYGLTYGIEPTKKFCPVCLATGQKSTISIGACMTTAMWCGNGYYDEDGNFHAPKECNKSTCDYTCSNGHSWAE